MRSFKRQSMFAKASRTHSHCPLSKTGCAPYFKISIRNGLKCELDSPASEFKQTCIKIGGGKFSGHSPDEIVFNHLLAGCATVPDVERAEWVLDSMAKHGVMSLGSLGQSQQLVLRKRPQNLPDQPSFFRHPLEVPAVLN